MLLAVLDSKVLV